MNRFIGGNSIRTWVTENAKEILDKSHELGISVCSRLQAVSDLGGLFSATPQDGG